MKSLKFKKIKIMFNTVNKIILPFKNPSVLKKNHTIKRKLKKKFRLGIRICS